MIALVFEAPDLTKMMIETRLLTVATKPQTLATRLHTTVCIRPSWIHEMRSLTVTPSPQRNFIL